MSFDLYVWGSPHPVTAEQAERICYELAAGNSSSVGADGRVQGFEGEKIEILNNFYRLVFEAIAREAKIKKTRNT